MTIYDKPSMSVSEVAKHLRLSSKQIRKLIDFDAKTNRPGPNSYFPNSYKRGPGRTASIRIPTDDVANYEKQMARRLNVFNRPFYTGAQAAKALGLSRRWLMQLINFDHTFNRPRPGSIFPGAYKATPFPNSRIRILRIEVQEYKNKQTRQETA